MLKTIAIASDHAGFELKNTLKKEIVKMGYQAIDLGTNNGDSVDYPEFGYKVAEKIANGECEFGVIICGSGIGISIAANRNPKARAALCHNAECAKLARQHNNANILAIGSRVVDEQTAKECLNIFLTTEFEGGRHKQRVEKLSKPN